MEFLLEGFVSADDLSTSLEKAWLSLHLQVGFKLLSVECTSSILHLLGGVMFLTKDMLNFMLILSLSFLFFSFIFLNDILSLFLFSHY